jgi:hypothetical protein
MLPELNEMALAAAIDLVGSIASLAGALYAGGMPDGVDPGGLLGGGAAAAAAATAAVAGGAHPTAGGANVTRDSVTRPSVPSSVQGRRDAQDAYDQTAVGRLDAGVHTQVERFRNWAESWGPYVPVIGIDHPNHPRNADRDPTVPAASKA